MKSIYNYDFVTHACTTADLVTWYKLTVFNRNINPWYYGTTNDTHSIKIAQLYNVVVAQQLYYYIIDNLCETKFKF